MKKLIVTLNINYPKEITDITYPYIESYAEKIDADFKVINERKFEDFPVNIEKFQIYELSKNYDWTIFVDSDAIIHPNCPDLTEVYEKDVVIFNAYDLYPQRFKPNNYTRRDKRNIGACTWLTIFSDWTRDIWKPYSDPKKYLDQIHPIHREINFGYTSDHILDDYLVSRNIAKYGIKVKTILNDMFSSYVPNKHPLFFIHEYSIPIEEKIKYLSDWDKSIKQDRRHIQNNPSLNHLYR